MSNTRSLIGETTLTMGSAESVTYTLDVSRVPPAATVPSSPSMSIENAWVDGTDVSLTNLSGAMSVSGQVLTLEEISSLVPGTTYRVRVEFTKTGVGEPWEVVFWIYCDD